MILFICFLGWFNNASGQITGCTDPNANNFNHLATINDGSCLYNLTVYNPNLRYLLPDEISETSGLAFYKNKLWTINDSGGLPVLYGLDTTSGDVVQRITIGNATNIDWESLADDDEYIYIGDFGNNAGNRDDLTIYKVRKSDIPDNGNATVSSSKIEFIYSDYTGGKINRRDHNFDCEAFIAFNGNLYLFSKNRGDQHSKLYKLSSNDGVQVAELVSSFNTSGLITGADINEKLGEITLIGYVNQSWVPFIWILFDYKDDQFFSGNKRRIDFPNIIATQTEAVIYTIGSNEVITSEGNIMFSQTAYDIETSGWTTASPSGAEAIKNSLFDFELSPNPVKRNKLNMEISGLPAGNYTVELYDSLGKTVYSQRSNVKRVENSLKIRLKVGNLSSGLYFVRLSSGDDKVEKKFVKK